MNRAIVDVDGTLWDFHTRLGEVLNELYEIPSGLAVKSVEWDWHKKFITDEQFFHAVDLVHDDQQSSEPYDHATELFDVLDYCGFETIVASHRRPQRAADLAAWITLHVSDKWSGMYAGNDKKFLIRERNLVIDDNPQTIAYAVAVGAKSYTLKWKWNENTEADRYSNLKIMAQEIKKRYA